MMKRLNGNLVQYLCEFLEIKEIVLSLGYTCHSLYRTTRSSDFFSHLCARGLGSPNLSPSLSLRLLLSTSKRPEQVLSLRAIHTTGGVYKQKNRYRLQNMFDYTGSAYTTDGVVENVVATAEVTDEPLKEFFEPIHEDLDWFNAGLLLPSKYIDMPLLDDILLTSRKPRRLSEVKYRRKLEFLSEPDEETVQKDAEIAAIVNRIAVGRPALATCPVRTILIATSAEMQSTDWTSFYNLFEFETVTANAQLNKALLRHVIGNGYEFAEFDGRNGPLLWLQFRQFDLLQVDIELKQRRFARQFQVILLDREDRTRDFGTQELGLDINYIAFTGWPLTSQGLAN